MEVGMSLNTLIRLPMKSKARTYDENSSIIKHSINSTNKCSSRRKGHMSKFVVEAKGKKGMIPRQFQRPSPPPLPEIEDDGNPRFVIFIRLAKVFLWYPVSLISGGSTAKLMLSAKDNFLGKYIYKDTIARNLAAVVYRDEEQIINMAKSQHRILRKEKEFRYGYKLVENNDTRAAFTPTSVVELPTPEQLKTVVDKVKDFFGDAKESFGKITSPDITSPEAADKTSAEKNKMKAEN